MFDNSLRRWKDRVLNPVARPLAMVNPIIITIIAAGFGLASMVFLANQAYAAGLTFWWLNRILDGLDGSVARLHQQQSDLGGYIDIMADFLVYAGLPIALVVGQPSLNGYLSLSFLLASFYINASGWMYLSAILEKRHYNSGTELTTIPMPAGLIGGTETIVFYTAFILWPTALPVLFVLMGGLVLITAGQRLVWAVKNLKDG